MKLWLVQFEGHYLGGKAVVRAKTTKEAKALVGERWGCPEEVYVATEIKRDDGPAILYYDNGDYWL